MLDFLLQNYYNYLNGLLYGMFQVNCRIYYLYNNLCYNFSVIKLYEKHCERKSCVISNFGIFR